MRRTITATAAFLALAAGVAGCSSGSGDSPTNGPEPASGATASGPAGLNPALLPVAHTTVWLCRPGMARNPCEGGLDATVVTAAGGRTQERFTPATDPSVDCFYVYPTASEAKTTNAPLAPEAAVIDTARAQAARFASACRLFVPVYRQVTITGLVTGKITDQAARQIGHNDVVSAWHDYLLHDNQGRKVVLIGHSQGTLELTQLMQEEIDGNAPERGLILSALLLGGRVTVPPGKDVGGSFTHFPACRKPSQIGCVVSYNSYGAVPPPDSLFGRPSSGQEVLCVNPVSLGPGQATPRAYVPVTALRGRANAVAGAGAPTRGFVAFPDSLSISCRRQNGVNWLQVDTRPGVKVPGDLLQPTLGPTWGLHRGDITLALGDLTALVAAQARAAR
jgi:Protein of unknown function (DUF3089)